jgi:hypothetical protein
MQASSNVVEVKPEEYENLMKPLARKDLYDIMREGETSSNFESEEALEFISTLDFDKKKPPTEREMQLIKGILPQNDRET